VLIENHVSYSSLNGIELYKSQRNLLSENTIITSNKSGISVVDSEENALVYNAVTDCAGPGIILESANTNLISDNHLQDNAIGVQALDSQRNRFLRNVIQENLLVGIIFTRGHDNLFLSNQVMNNPFGIALLEASGNHLLRNAVVNSSEDGISLLNRSKHNIVQTNEIDRNGVGVLLASSSQNTIMENTILRNEIGLRLFLSGVGTRVETNSISDNEFGVEINDELKIEDTLLGSTDVELLHEGETDSSFIITNNTFYRNKSYDIWNQTEDTIFAGGNRWEDPSLPPSGKREQVSSGVIVPPSALKDAIAVGTRDSLDQVMLGRLIQLALQDNGFKVIDLIGLGEAERLKGALLDGDVDLAWSDPRMLNAEELLSSEFTSFPTIAVQNRFAVVVSPELASKLASRTTSELSHLIREGGVKVIFAVPNTLSRAEFESCVSLYDLPITEEDVIWTKGLEETEILLQVGTVQVGFVRWIEETLSLTGFLLLEDDKSFFAVSQSALTVDRGLLARYPEIETIEMELSPLLTAEIIHSLASHVRLLHRDPTEVAREFLLREGLITW
jgi:osmoprotectant transport system substrate-binding protein